MTGARVQVWQGSHAGLHSSSLVPDKSDSIHSPRSRSQAQADLLRECGQALVTKISKLLWSDVGAESGLAVIAAATLLHIEGTSAEGGLFVNTAAPSTWRTFLPGEHEADLCASAACCLRSLVAQVGRTTGIVR